MLIARKRLGSSYYWWHTALITVHDRYLHSRLSNFYAGYPYCENAHEIEEGIFIVSLREMPDHLHRYLYLCDGFHPVQWYTISEEEYWALNPVPF